jgi:anaphase-promoting complex subunit 11
MASITINHMKFIASKSLNIISDICAICQENISDKCSICCQNNINIKCYSVIGVCKHAYHLCCINDWTSRQLDTRCPMCNQKWELKKRSIN